MRWFLFLMLMSTHVFAANTYMKTGVVAGADLQTGARDANIINRPVGPWSTDIQVASHYCGLLNFCNNKYFLTPENSTGEKYIDNETGKSYTVYKTSESQIGVVYEIRDATQSTYTPANGTSKMQFFASGPASVFESYARARLIFINQNGFGPQIAYSISNTIKIGSVVSNASSDGPDDIYLENVSFTQTTQTCSINSNSGNKILLGDLNESMLVNTGSAGPEVPFSLSYYCPANVTVKGYLIDMLHPDNTSDILIINEKLTGAAQGVAIKINFNQKTLSLGLDSHAQGGINEISFLPSSSIPSKGELNLSAKVVKTGEVKAGKVSATLGITFSYQ